MADEDFAADIAAVQAIDRTRAILEEVCGLTGMGFAAVARVTESRWIACQLLDRIEFGLEPGDELEIGTTICNEIRASGHGVFIDHVAGNTEWRTHHTPALYGFQSYISLPIQVDGGGFFGTLCAIDPAPRHHSLAVVFPTIAQLAHEIGVALSRQPRGVSS